MPAWCPNSEVDGQDFESTKSGRSVLTYIHLFQINYIFTCVNIIMGCGLRMIALLH